MDGTLVLMISCYDCMINEHPGQMPCDDWEECTHKKICGFLQNVATMGGIISQLGLIEMFRHIDSSNQKSVDDFLDYAMNKLLNFADEMGFGICYDLVPPNKNG